MEIRFGNLLFTSKFDSGNLARVEKVQNNEESDSCKLPLIIFICYHFITYFQVVCIFENTYYFSILNNIQNIIK